MVILAGIIIGVATGLACTVFFRPDRIKGAENIIAAALVAIGIGVGVLSSLNENNSFPIASAFATSSAFLLLPAFFLIFIRFNIGIGTRWDYFWLSPAFIHFVLLMIGQATAENYSFVDGFVVIPTHNLALGIPSVLPLTFGILYPLLSFHMARQHFGKLLDVVSNFERVHVIWIAQIQLVGLFGTLIVVSITLILGKNHFAIPQVILGVLSLQLLAILSFYLRQKNAPASQPYENVQQGEPSLNDTDSSLSTEYTAIIRCLDNAMRSSQLYLQQELSIDDLADAVDINREKISSALKQNDLNFYEYVNRWRIEEAKQLLSKKENQNISILSISFDSGFSSKATFNRVFKKMVGITPSDYRRRKAMRQTER